MKIAYYEENNYHTEIFGTFLYYLNVNRINVTVYNNSDKSDYINYYKKICDFELKNTDEILKDHPSFDYIIIGTSYSTEHIKDIYNDIKNKMIPVCHLMENINSDINCFVLTPLNTINNKCHYVLPIHNFITETNNINKKNIFTLVGRFKDNNRDTADILFTLNKFKHLNFELHIYARHIKFIPKSLMEFSKLNPNKLKIFLKTKTNILEKKISESKYLLTLVSKNSCYHKDRLSGIIPLSFNYNIPLIMDKKLNQIYNFSSCLTYENSLSEIIEKATNISDNDYTDLVNQVKDEKINIINNNNLVLSKLLK